MSQLPRRLPVEAQSRWLPIADGHLHYWRMGQGERVLVLLHGFADSGLLFERLMPELADDYTILAPDLPAHGRTVWQGEWRPADLAAWIEALLQREQATHWELGGFSMGGRLVLCVLPLLHPRPGRVWLLAPDGIGTRWVTLLDMVPSWLRRACRPLLLRPALLLGLAGGLHAVGVLDRWTWFFLRYQLHTAPRRQRLADTWCALAHFKVRWRRLRPHLAHLQGRVWLVMGREDPLIRRTAVARFARRMGMTLAWLPTAHDDFVGKELARWWKGVLSEDATG